MKKTDELKQLIDAKRIEVTNLMAENKMTEAQEAAQNLREILNQYKVASALEESAFENFKKSAAPATSLTDTAKLCNRAFNKLVFKLGDLTDEERGAYFNAGQIEATPAKGGYLVPVEQMKQLQEFRKDFVELKNYCTVVTANSTSGRWATYTSQDLEFQAFSELNDIAESDVTFGEATYLIKDRGLILPISNQLIDDADINIISFLGRQLAEGAVKTENKVILEPLTTLITGDTSAGIAEAATITSYKSLNTALWKTLDGVYYPSAKIFTNQDGFLWLSNLDDGNNRPLLVPDVTEPSKYFYRGKEIVVIPNSTLPNTASGSKNYAPFLVGDLKSYLAFFTRKGLELSTSTEYGWRRYATYLRAVIRFGVVVNDSNAMTALKVEV